MFNVNNKDFFHNGATVYTNKGYGKIKQKHTDQTYSVLVDSEEIILKTDEIYAHIPIHITIITGLSK